MTVSNRTQFSCHKQIWEISYTKSKKIAFSKNFLVFLFPLETTYDKNLWLEMIYARFDSRRLRLGDISKGNKE